MEKPTWYPQRNAREFQRDSVADAYRYRPPYPPAVFELLGQLLPRDSQRILDIGCGTGFVARELPGLHLQVDAVDISEAMVTHGKALPGGDDPAIRWQVGSIETIPLTGPYDMITAGESLHLMDWRVVLPRLARLLSPDGFLVVMDLSSRATAWQEELLEIIRRYSAVPDYREVDLATELANRGLFIETSRTETEPWMFRQSIDDYIESFHGRASFSRERMSSADIDAFDSAVRALVSGYTDDVVELPVVAKVVWGKPVDGAGTSSGDEDS